MDTLFFDLNILKIKVRALLRQLILGKVSDGIQKKMTSEIFSGKLLGKISGKTSGNIFGEDFGENSIEIYLKKVQYCYFFYLF